MILHISICKREKRREHWIRRRKHNHNTCKTTKIEIWRNWPGSERSVTRQGLMTFIPQRERTQAYNVAYNKQSRQRKFAKTLIWSRFLRNYLYSSIANQWYQFTQRFRDIKSNIWHLESTRQKRNTQTPKQKKNSLINGARNKWQTQTSTTTTAVNRKRLRRTGSAAIRTTSGSIDCIVTSTPTTAANPVQTHTELRSIEHDLFGQTSRASERVESRKRTRYGGQRGHAIQIVWMSVQHEHFRYDVRASPRHAKHARQQIQICGGGLITTINNRTMWFIIDPNRTITY